ncbi:hypothetical protein Aduo_006981 [Ancylostoma duodenale]
MATVVFLFAVISIALACIRQPSPPPSPSTRPPPPITAKAPKIVKPVTFILKEPFSSDEKNKEYITEFHSKTEEFIEDAKKELDKFIKNAFVKCLDKHYIVLDPYTIYILNDSKVFNDFSSTPSLDDSKL